MNRSRVTFNLRVFLPYHNVAFALMSPGPPPTLVNIYFCRSLCPTVGYTLALALALSTVLRSLLRLLNIYCPPLL